MTQYAAEPDVRRHAPFRAPQLLRRARAASPHSDGIRQLRFLLIALPLLLAYLSSGTSADTGAASPRASIASLDASGKVLLILSDRSDAVAVPVESDAGISATCRHCNMPMKFVARDASKRCGACLCGASNADCVMALTAKLSRWQDLFAMLPRGTVVLPTWRKQADPSAGITGFKIDMHSVLLPVSGLDDLSSAQLMELARSAGCASAERASTGRLSFTTRESWSARREAGLEKAIAARGGRITWPPQSAG